MADSKSQNRRAYIPPHVQQQMSKQLQQNVPKHMQQYVGAFMEQNVVNPQKYGNPGGGMSTTGNNPTGRPQTYRPVTHLPRNSHYQQYQTPDRPPTDLYPAQPSLPAQPGQPPAPAPQPVQQPYDFIMNSEHHHGGPALPGAGSLLGRVAYAAAGLLILLVLFSFVRGFFAPESPAPYFLSVAQDQQELIRLTEAAKEQPDLSTGNLNFAITAKLSLTTSQAETVKYIGVLGKNVDGKQLGLKLSQKTDEQLAAAAAATTYNQTFKEVMNDELKAYMNDLKTTYNKTPGKNGQAVLNQNYNQAELLLKQLNGPTQ